MLAIDAACGLRYHCIICFWQQREQLVPYSPSTYEPLASWRPRPSGRTWCPGLSDLGGEDRRAAGQIVPLRELLSTVRQGVFARSFGQGDLRVRTIRVGDLHPLLLADGEVRPLNADSVQRHLAGQGDILVARVGRPGQVSCVTTATEPLVPNEGVLVARPVRKEWGPAIAAALCTDYVRTRLSALQAERQTTNLTIEQLEEIGVPSPQHFDYAAVEAIVESAGELVRAGCQILDRIRGLIELLLEGAPTAPTKQVFAWIGEPGWMPGWGWSDAQRYLLTERTHLRRGSLIRLGDAVVLDICRLRMIEVPVTVRVLERNDAFRPDWHLATPVAESLLEVSDAQAVPRRYYEVDRESLLVPTVGDITGPPVVIPGEALSAEMPPVLVPLHWLPLRSLPYPRTMAMILDHPFVRLQRQLAGSFSTVAHITRDDIADLLIPAVSVETWGRWETELRQAHRLFIEADSKAKEAIAIVERWYA